MSNVVQVRYTIATRGLRARYNQLVRVYPSASPRVYTLTRLRLGYTRSLGFASGIHAHSASPRVYTLTRLRLGYTRSLGFASGIHAHSASPRVYTLTRLRLGYTRSLGFASGIHAHSASPRVYTLTRLRLGYTRSLLGYGRVTHSLLLYILYLLGERSEPHTGVFNRDFA